MRQGKTTIYFLQEQGPKKLIKIGCTVNGNLRISAVNYWCPYSASFLASIEGHKSLEIWLHSKFSFCRSHGEWFKPSKELLATIEEIKKTRSFKGFPKFCKNRTYGKYVSKFDDVLKKMNMTASQLSKEVGLSSFTLRKGMKSYGSFRSGNFGTLSYGRVLSPTSIWQIKEFAKSKGILLKDKDFFMLPPSGYRDAA